MDSEVESRTFRNPSSQEKSTETQPYPWTNYSVWDGMKHGAETHGDSTRIFTRDLGIFDSFSCGAQTDSIAVITWVGSIP